MKKPKRDDQTKAGRPFLGGTLYESGNRSPLLYGMCLTFGLLVLYAGFLRPLLMVYRARHWPATSCTIISSGLKSGKGQMYAEDIVYSYEVAGKTYQANRYEFYEGWYKDGRNRLQKERDIGTQYPTNSKTTCYVNPHDPTDAVLHRRMGTIPILFVAPICLVLIAVGTRGLKQRFRHQQQRRKSKRR